MRARLIPLIALLLLAPTAAAGAAEGSPAADVPTVSVAPADPPKGAPNAGGWFYEQVAAGGRASSAAILTNVADVAQTVTVFARDLTFTDAGTPQVGGADPEDVGAWVTPTPAQLTVEPGRSSRVDFTIDVPDAAEPGDHVGVLVVESSSSDGQLSIVKRVATRLYVTVPGVATRAVEIESVDATPTNVLFPRELDVVATVRNTGRVRVEPRVTVADVTAVGASPLLSQSSESYMVRLDVPWYGGLIRYDTAVSAESDVLARAEGRILVLPWALIAGVLLAATSGAFVGYVTLDRRRRGRQELERLRSEVRRLAGVPDDEEEDEPERDERLLEPAG